MPLPSSAKPVRVCDNCHPLLLQRYSSTGNWGPSAVWSVSTMSECNGYHVVMTGPQDVQTLFVTATPQISNGLIKVSPQFSWTKSGAIFPFVVIINTFRYIVVHVLMVVVHSMTNIAEHVHVLCCYNWVCCLRLYKQPSYAIFVPVFIYFYYLPSIMILFPCQIIIYVQCRKGLYR